MPNTSRGLAVGNALVTFATANLSSLGLVYCDWQKGMAPGPVYPIDPSADCPRLELRAYVEEIDAAVARSTRTLLKFGWWYYRLQTPGQAHQKLLRADLETIVNLFFGNFNPLQLELAGANFTRPAQTVIHDDLRHAFDDPTLAVSVGEILMEIACIGQA